MKERCNTLYQPGLRLYRMPSIHIQWRKDASYAIIAAWKSRRIGVFFAFAINVHFVRNVSFFFSIYFACYPYHSLYSLAGVSQANTFSLSPSAFY
ncbi:MAG: hypothetical protein QXT63_02005 [Thermoplasmata archaeon]